MQANALNSVIYFWFLKHFKTVIEHLDLKPRLSDFDLLQVCQLYSYAQITIMFYTLTRNDPDIAGLSLHPLTSPKSSRRYGRRYSATPNRVNSAVRS